MSMRLDPLADGRYIPLELISSGPMSEVHLCEDRDLSRKVVIKLVRVAENTLSGNQGQTGALESFKHEVGILARDRYSRVVPIYDCGEEKQGNYTLAYMVMPYCEEGSLEDWLVRHRVDKPLEITEVAKLLDQAGDALNHLHKNCIIHRDIKASNFLVESLPDSSTLPNLWLADFGLAQLSVGDVPPDSKGTSFYKAPEQWAKGWPIFATDQYQLAIMAYYLLTRRHPFEGNKDDVRNRHIYSTPPAPSTLRPDIPREIDDVILRALEKQPSKRYPSVQAFVDVFRKATEVSIYQRAVLTARGLMMQVNPVLASFVEPLTSSIRIPLGEQSLLTIIKPRRLVSLIVASLVLSLLSSSLSLHSSVPSQNALCDRNCVVDTDTVNSVLKGEASALQLQGNNKGACNYWYWASQEDPTDGEARIAYQNYPFQLNSANPCSMPIRSSSSINLVAVVAYGNDELDGSSRAILQGVALRQQEFNDAHPGGPSLRISLAKVTSSNQASVAQQILDATNVQGQSSVVGVIGFPIGSDTLINALSSYNIPMISIMPADDNILISSLLSVAPSFRDQADATINIIQYQTTRTPTHVKVVPFYRSGDLYGKKLVDTFWQAVQDQQVVSLPPQAYTNLDDLIQDVQSISDLSILYFAGSIDDARQLQAALHQKGSSSLQILGPADMYKWIYKNYTSDQVDNLMDLQFTAFAYHNSSSIHDLGGSQCIVPGSISTSSQYNMTEDYPRDFDSNGLYFGSAYDHDIPSSDTILAYDAVSLMDTAGLMTRSSLSISTLWSALQKFTPNHPFQGFSGQISFQEGKSTPYKKAVLLITIARQGKSIENTTASNTANSSTVWQGCYQFTSK